MIVIDIGNTHSRIGKFENGKVKLLRIVNTKNLDSSLIPENEKIFAATVVPEVKKFLPNIHYISACDAQCHNLIDFSMVDSSTLGADRVANSVAAISTLILPALIVDCGSAITIELIDSERHFLGGAITPGRKLLRQTLYTNTAQLPEIPLSNSLPKVPGANTVDALHFGIDRGVIGVVKELIYSCELCYGNFTKVVTGGDGEYFAQALNLRFLPEDFTLLGVGIIGEAIMASSSC